MNNYVGSGGWLLEVGNRRFGGLRLEIGNRGLEVESWTRCQGSNGIRESEFIIPETNAITDSIDKRLQGQKSREVIFIKMVINEHSI